jgi:hypothetical protein
MAGQKRSLTGRCQGCNHPERVRIERFFGDWRVDQGSGLEVCDQLSRAALHWRNHVSAEARATYVAGAGASKDQLEEIVADESLGLLDQAPRGTAARELPGLRATDWRAAARPAAGE